MLVECAQGASRAITMLTWFERQFLSHTAALQAAIKLVPTTGVIVIEDMPFIEHTEHTE